MRKQNNYKNIVNDSIRGCNRLQKLVSALLFIVVIIYMFLPLNIGEGIFGRLDDFFFFMASFSYMYSIFINKKSGRASILLKLCALLFCLLGAMSLFLIIYLN